MEQSITIKNTIKLKKMMDKEQYESIAKEIHSDTSPVGIDAKKTHILILQKLIKIEERLDRLENKLQ
ncbi:hypothetical protein [Aquimarina algiphila]|uniref:hypothetical protein n=1 Tax=Aquimarina algiphila TaxID=2047982 RepID=UPI00232D4868|nr:hypothetical protein [Aquimarina algiphila]